MNNDTLHSFTDSQSYLIAQTFFFSFFFRIFVFWSILLMFRHRLVLTLLAMLSVFCLIPFIYYKLSLRLYLFIFIYLFLLLLLLLLLFFFFFRTTLCTDFSYNNRNCFFFWFFFDLIWFDNLLVIFNLNISFFLLFFLCVCVCTVCLLKCKFIISCILYDRFCSCLFFFRFFLLCSNSLGSFFFCFKVWKKKRKLRNIWFVIC